MSTVTVRFRGSATHSLSARSPRAQFYLYVLFGIVFAGRKAASLQSSNVKRIYNVTSGMIIVLWTGYPIIFALTEGKGRISVDAEIICYGILDVVSSASFCSYCYSFSLVLTLTQKLACVRCSSPKLSSASTSSPLTPTLKATL